MYGFISSQGFQPNLVFYCTIGRAKISLITHRTLYLNLVFLWSVLFTQDHGVHGLRQLVVAPLDFTKKKFN